MQTASNKKSTVYGKVSTHGAFLFALYEGLYLELEYFLKYLKTSESVESTKLLSLSKDSP